MNSICVCLHNIACLYNEYGARIKFCGEDFGGIIRKYELVEVLFKAQLTLTWSKGGVKENTDRFIDYF